VFNHYQGFSTNPIVLVDLTGHFSVADLLIDIGMTILFAVAAVATAGAALAAAPAIVGAEAAVTTSTIVATVAEAAGAMANATGFVVSALKAADDIDDAVSHKHFLSKDQRSALGWAQVAAGVVATVTGLVTVGALGAGAFAEGAEQDAADFLRGPDDETDVTNAAGKRNAFVEGEQPDYIHLGPGEEIPPDPLLSNVEASTVTPSYNANDAGSSIDAIVGGPSPAQVPRLVTRAASQPISIQQPVLREVVGSNDLNVTDGAVFKSDRGLTTALKTGQAAQRSLSGSLDADVARSVGTPGTSPTRTAMNGNWSAEARNAMLNPGESHSIDAVLNRDTFSS
jgi:hypothetical protein